MHRKTSIWVLIALLTSSFGLSASAATVARQIARSGTIQLPATVSGTTGLALPETSPIFDRVPNLADGPSSTGRVGTQAIKGVLQRAEKFKINRSIATATGKGEFVESLTEGEDVGDDADDDENADQRNPKRITKRVLASFDGPNSRNQRLANKGNQFSVQPPDQALCAGNGYVLSSVNTVLKITDRSGKSLSGDVDLNSFYGYPAAIDRGANPPRFGPAITDPVCYFDPQVNRWFHAVLTLDTFPSSGNLTGTNHLDLAVSNSGNPLESWSVYRLPVQNDGTEGTPSHPNCPCLGDYPHIGADAHGIYLTTNEFPFSGGFNSAQIYALPKAALVAGSSTVQVVQLDTADYLLDGNPGFTVWPAVSPAGDVENDNRGTEYLLSSVAVFANSGNDSRLRVWALGNTSSLATANPNLTLLHDVVNVDTYGVPPVIKQKPGVAPLRDCLNDRALPTPFGIGCWNYLTTNQPAVTETLVPLDPNDSRMQQVFFTANRLYGALDTVVTVGGKEQAGVAYYVLKPNVSGNRVSASVFRQGKLAFANNSVTRPAIAALPNGKGLIGFTLVGDDHFPSAAYIRFSNAKGHRGNPVKIVGIGKGPDDEFGGYNAFGLSGGRWGDYAAAAIDGDHIWIASEYIGQRCSLAEFTTPSNLFSCNGTRVALTNWGTRVSLIKP
ncbi:hypothetical protein [Actimicrobium antarcticum]|uniref:Uncharacterized protein n=1 Tax=Actimicrobium antarcticum TaxID=1051899 RepID=A0ABP7TL65_9BURK